MFVPLAFFLGTTGVDRAKDMGSAAVLFSLLNAAIIWACVLWG